MTPVRWGLARMASQILPPLIANRLNLRLIYPLKRAREDGFEFRTRAVTGSFFNGNIRDIHCHVFSMNGYCDWRLIAVAGAVLRPGDIVIEVGANVGTETICLADLVGPEGRVFAFEPLPSNLKQLRKLNDPSGLRQVEVHPFAVSDQIGTVQFVPPDDPVQSGIGHIRGGNEQDGADMISVPCTTLDAIFSERGPIRLLSIDAEGAEISILRGANMCLDRDRPVLILEAAPAHLHRSGGDLVELHGELTSRGYCVYQINRLGLGEPDLSGRVSSNWVGLPESMTGEAATIHRRLLVCGLVPCLRGLNPLTRIAND